MGELSDRLIAELVDAVRAQLRKETIERLRELAAENSRPITLYINSAGGNVTDGLALHDAIRQLVLTLSLIHI